MNRVCKDCRKSKDLELDFYREAKDPQGRQRSCKSCISAYQKSRRRNSPGLVRDQYLKREYGISLDEYREMVDRQNGVCAICGSGGKLHVDHDHKTG